jgi:hypothetical protein
LILKLVRGCGFFPRYVYTSLLSKQSILKFENNDDVTENNKNKNEC